MRKRVYRLRRSVVGHDWNCHRKVVGWVIEEKRWWGWKRVMRSSFDLTQTFEDLQTPMTYREIAR